MKIKYLILIVSAVSIGLIAADKAQVEPDSIKLRVSYRLETNEWSNTGTFNTINGQQIYYYHPNDCKPCQKTHIEPETQTWEVVKHTYYHAGESGEVIAKTSKVLRRYKIETTYTITTNVSKPIDIKIKD